MEKTKPTIGDEVKSIVWDLDGTLLDSFGIYQECLNQVLPTHGLRPVSNAVLLSNHHGSIEESIKGVLEDTGQSVSDAVFKGIIDDFLVLDNAYIRNVDDHLFQDAVDLAIRAHDAGKFQVIVTRRFHGPDRGNASPHAMVANSRLRAVIDEVICGDEVTIQKPLRRVLEPRFGLDLSALGEPIVIGDQYVDAEFARNLHCRAILVARERHIAHMDRLENWKAYTTIVDSLDTVGVD